MTGLNIVARVIYRDALVLVLDKPAGLAVHRGGTLSRTGETLSDHLDDLRFGLPRRPEAAHRLDRDTSGCLVLGRHARALTLLGALFRANRIDKTYWATVAGGPEDETGEIALPLGPAGADKRRMKVDGAGQAALTRWRVLGRADGRTWLELKPVTGRTHQLRVHCAAMGWPILGDRIYGVEEGGGLMLHARAIAVPLYPKKPPILVEAPVPDRMVGLLPA